MVAFVEDQYLKGGEFRVCQAACIEGGGDGNTYASSTLRGMIFFSGSCGSSLITGNILQSSVGSRRACRKLIGRRGIGTHSTALETAPRFLTRRSYR
jgi:hypothetical protein